MFINKIFLTTMRYDYTLIRMTKIKWQDQMVVGIWKTGPFICYWSEDKMVQPTLALIKLNTQLYYDPAIAPLDIYGREMKTYLHMKTWTQTFPEDLFIIAKNCNQPRDPSTSEYIPWNTTHSKNYTYRPPLGWNSKHPAEWKKPVPKSYMLI